MQSKRTSPKDVLLSYGKVALKSHERTNCLTEIMFPEAEAWLAAGEINLKGPLAGIPISLKDSIQVGGFDNTIGYSRYAGQRAVEDGGLVKLLKKAGAVPFVKTNLPITLLSFESSNDVWGRTLNPHNADYSPGGSTGGESALLACGGSRIGIGSDVAGSVRVPAHWSGCYSIRCSIGRWPKLGVRTSTLGQEGVQSVFSPMSRTLDDLRYFTREMIKMKPWEVDPTCVPLEWRTNIEEEWADKKVLKVGVLRDDGKLALYRSCCPSNLCVGVVTPTPACARAINIVVDSLKAAGHIVRDISPPSPYEGLQIASQLLNADGCSTFSSHFRSFETNDPGASQLWTYMKIPRIFKYVHYLWIKYIRRDPLWADLLIGWNPKTASENWELVARRESYKVKWINWWNTEDVDVILATPNATPALPHKAMHDAVSSCGYTFLFNLVSLLPTDLLSI